MATGNGYIYVTNWEKFQHYKKRNPPWIKFYYDLLDDDEYMALSPSDKVLLQTIWLLTSRAGNGRLRADQGRLTAAAGTPKGRLASLVQAGLISIRASKALSKTLAPEYRPPTGNPAGGRTDTESRASTSASTTGSRNGKEPEQDDPPPAPPDVAADALAKLRAIATPAPIDPDDEEL